MVVSREIDKIVATKPRPLEMQVLCLGLSPMYTALNKLGYRSYHMLEAPKPYNKRYRHINCWREALNFKVHGIGQKYSPEDFDKLLQEYSAVTDMPCVNFAAELVAAFPNAKVVLTQREPSSWVKSVETSIYSILGWRIWPFLIWLDPEGLGALHDCLQLGLADWTSPKPWTDRNALARYMPDHIKHIRSLIAPENLLEFHPRDGWEPLCKFLGKASVPDEPFPYVNQGSNAANIVKVGVTLKLIKMSMPYILVIGVAIWAWGWSISA
ncbi:hypothetical protein HYFRA_00004556 [Hymenoscyphus fraxineus]|uniref:NAD dependent epimerase/dehydratase n=1 Tax=Hymenoscyphus fraxineus TaxID=746836 RepID=A0A9N9PPH8_9HELO|nr:hypothetical protein HYFRA_00004556 [Hymenoscyphus fraxineus]